MKSGGPAHSWDIIVVLVVTLIICDRRRMWVRARGDQVLVAQLNFVMARQVTVVLCIERKGRTENSNVKWETKLITVSV